MKNSDIDDLFTKSLKPLSEQGRPHSITDQVMQRVAQEDQDRLAQTTAIPRNVILLVGLLFGLGAGTPAFLDLTAWLPELAGSLSWLPEVGSVRSELNAWWSDQAVNSNLAAVAMLAGLMALLVLFPALEE